jgi:hypothetical protein
MNSARTPDECRQQTAKAFNPLDKERWLKIAEHWLLMAQDADPAPITGGADDAAKARKNPASASFSVRR